MPVLCGGGSNIVGVPGGKVLPDLVSTFSVSCGYIAKYSGSIQITRAQAQLSSLTVSS